MLRKVPGSALFQETTCLCWDSTWLSSVFLGNNGTVNRFHRNSSFLIDLTLDSPSSLKASLWSNGAPFGHVTKACKKHIRLVHNVGCDLFRTMLHWCRSEKTWVARYVWYVRAQHNFCNVTFVSTQWFSRADAIVSYVITHALCESEKQILSQVT